MDWNHRASLLAEYHHDEDFESRMGVIPLYDDSAFYLFNNCPPRNNMIERDRELNGIRGEAAKLGIQELGYAEYPKQGVNEGYSYAIIFQGDEHHCQQFEELLWR